MENASGRSSLRESLLSSLRTLLLRPHRILTGKPFFLITLLYGGTYLTANTLDTLTTTLHPSLPPSHVTTGTAKFASSSLANVALCIYKDQHFVRMFGPPGAAAAQRAVPAASYALFAARDCLTIFASFNVPPLLGPVFSARMGKELEKRISGQTVAQFAAPAAVQLLSTPLHLLGLDLYNRPKILGGSGAPGPSWVERWNLVRKNWAVSSAARMCRIMPAFGVGGVVNTKMRGDFMAKLG